MSENPAEEPNYFAKVGKWLLKRPSRSIVTAASLRNYFGGPDARQLEPSDLVAALRRSSPSRVSCWSIRSSRSAASFLPIRLYGTVDPHLNRACVKAIVVVVAAAVQAAVADVGNESARCAVGRRGKENATA
jgi:hypothetical protein